MLILIGSMKVRYTDEELSRILGECDRGGLVPSGCGKDDFAAGNDERCCINQAAYLEPSCGAAVQLNYDPALWFDENYDHAGDPDRLLRDLEALEVA